MSETVLFVVGIVIFAITIYGAVMAGGLMLTRVELAQEPDSGPGAADDPAPRGLPVNRKY